MKTIKCTDKQYEVLRAIVKTLSRNLTTRESYTKHLHKSRKQEIFSISIPWKQVRLLQHMEDQFK